MSRVGKRPIKFSSDVEIVLENSRITMSKNSNTMVLDLPKNIKAIKNEDNIALERTSEDKTTRSLHGLYARLIKNAISGLSEGISKQLDFKGTGYRARVDSGTLFLSMGYSHELEMKIPEGVTVNVTKSSIIVNGYDAQIVGNFAASVREVRKPEVYKGKGIRYSYEVIKRKDGKAAQGGKV